MIKMVALVAILTLRLSGIWPQLPAALATSLNQTAAGASTNLIATPAPIPPLPVQTGNQPLELGAASALAIDTATDTILYAQNPDTRRPIASINKLVEALVIPSCHPLDQAVTVPDLPTYDPADETIGLHAGEIYTERDLLTAMLVGSEDDAADALALADAGSTAKFAAEMNAKMTEWGIKDTHFSNPSGLQDTGNYATATALAKIAQLALTNPFIRQTVAEQSATVTSRADRVLPITTTDELLASGNFYGIKTGFTPAAGECFVGLTHIDGHEVITVVLGATDRFGATTNLVNWIGTNWQWL
jgi:serine-type D-Ala-D-Ala carboxypeptidase (penicillin-binding protein 5/6)